MLFENLMVRLSPTLGTSSYPLVKVNIMSRIFAAVVLLFVFMGCDSVTVNQPFGEQSSRNDIDGIWRSDELPWHCFLVRTTSKGGAYLGITTWDKELQEFKTSTGSLEIRKHAGREFIFAKRKPPEIGWCLLAILVEGQNENECKIRLSDPASFRRLVVEKTLPGKIVSIPQPKSGRKMLTADSEVEIEVQLEATDGTLEKYLETTKLKRLFLQNPTFEFKRLSKDFRKKE